MTGAEYRLRTLKALSPRDPERMTWAAYLAQTGGDRDGLNHIAVWWSEAKGLEN